MPNAKTRITKARINFISLCPRGANRLPVIYKADDTFEFDTLTKASADAGEILAVIYAPELVDAQGEVASVEVIKDMAHGFMRNRGNVDLRHNERALRPEQAYVAETFLVAKGDSRFVDWKDAEGKPVGDLTGSWAALIKVDDESLRQEYRDGKWNGVSMGGVGARAVVKDDSAAGVLEQFRTFLKSLVNKNPQESDMTPAEIAKLVTDGIAAAVPTITEAVKKALEPPKPAAAAQGAEDKAPSFSGDPTPENVAKFQKELEAFEIRRDLNSGDATKVAKAVERVTKQTAAPAAETDEVKALRKQVETSNAALAKALGRSNVPGDAPVQTAVEKECAEAVASGERMSEIANRRFGTYTAAK